MNISRGSQTTDRVAAGRFGYPLSGPSPPDNKMKYIKAIIITFKILHRLLGDALEFEKRLNGLADMLEGNHIITCYKPCRFLKDDGTCDKDLCKLHHE